MADIGLQRMTREKGDGARSGGNEGERRHAERGLAGAGATDRETFGDTANYGSRLPEERAEGEGAEKKQTARPDEEATVR